MEDEAFRHSLFSSIRFQNIIHSALSAPAFPAFLNNSIISELIHYFGTTLT